MRSGFARLVARVLRRILFVLSRSNDTYGSDPNVRKSYEKRKGYRP